MFKIISNKNGVIFNPSADAGEYSIVDNLYLKWHKSDLLYIDQIIEK